MKRIPNVKLNIKIAPKKKKINSESSKIKFKINKGGINSLYSFFNLKEQIILSQINNKFRNAFLSLFNIVKKESKDFITYLSFLFKLEYEAENYSPYLNVFLDINIVNLAQYKLGKINKGKIKALISFIDYRYKLTQNKHFYLSIHSMDDFNLNKEVILSLNNFQKFKYTLRFLKDFKFEDTISLFKEIPFINCIEEDRHETYDIYSKIQNYIFSNNIEAFHNKIYSQKLDNAKSYFKKYPNHLYCITNEKQYCLIEDNKESIYKFDDNSVHPNLLNYPNLKLKTIKYTFADGTFNENFENLNLSEIENIGGFNISNDEEVDLISKELKKIKKLKKLNNIEFGDEDEATILLKFLDKIKDINIKSLSFWFQRISIEENGIEKLINYFPNLRKFYENSDCSGVYDSSITISNCFSLGICKYIYKDNNLKAILKLINNYLAHQKEGRKFIKFDIFCDDDFIPSLIKFAYDNNEDNIINSIYSFNVIVSGNTIKEMNELKKLNYFVFDNESQVLFNSLKNVNKINLIKISDVKYLNNNFDLIKQFNPDYIFYNNKFSKDIINKLEKIKSLKYVFLNDENYQKEKNKKFKFEIYPSNILIIDLEN